MGSCISQDEAPLALVVAAGMVVLEAGGGVDNRCLKNRIQVEKMAARVCKRSSGCLCKPVDETSSE